MEQHPIKINKVQIRNLQIEDYVQLSQSFTRVYSDGSDVFWTREQIQKLIKIFPEGQIVTVVDDKIVGCALSIIVDYDKVKKNNTALDIYYCASGSWGGNVYANTNSSTNKDISFDLTVKSGTFGSSKYDLSTGIYVGGRYGGTHYSARKAKIEGGYISNRRPSI